MAVDIQLDIPDDEELSGDEDELMVRRCSQINSGLLQSVLFCLRAVTDQVHQDEYMI